MNQTLSYVVVFLGLFLPDSAVTFAPQGSLDTHQEQLGVHH